MRKADGTKVQMRMGNVRENYGDDEMPMWQKVLIAIAALIAVIAIVWFFMKRRKGAGSQMGFSKSRFGFRFY